MFNTALCVRFIWEQVSQPTKLNPETEYKKKKKSKTGMLYFLPIPQFEVLNFAKPF